MKKRRACVIAAALLLLAGAALVAGYCVWKHRADRIPHINICVHEINWDDKIPCEIMYTCGEEHVKFPARIKFRGGMSSRYAKHSYAVELNEKYALAGLPCDDDYILNANYIDKTMMRHKLSYELYTRMNPYKNVAAQCAYVNVSVNSSYEGLYVLMEKITAKKAGLDKKDTMAMLFKDPPVFWGENRITPQEEGNYFQQKYPKIEQQDKTWYMEQFMHFLFYASPEAFADNIEQWIDVDNVIDWHLLLLYTNNDDGLLKNFYLYKQDSRTPMRIAIWDYDHSYGRDCDNELNMLRSTINVSKCVLIRRLMQAEKVHYKQRLKQRWLYLRGQDIFSVKAFERMIAQNNRQIRNEVKQNFDRWPVNAEYYYDSATYEQELDLMRQYMRKRLPQLDAYFEAIP